MFYECECEYVFYIDIKDLFYKNKKAYWKCPVCKCISHVEKLENIMGKFE